MTIQGNSDKEELLSSCYSTIFWIAIFVMSRVTAWLQRVLCLFVADMTDATNLFDERSAELERQIQALREEQAMLAKFKQLLGSFPHVLRPNDRFTSRTATKFELLARVVTHLNRPDCFLYGGASTKSIYEAVVEDIRVDKLATQAANSDPNRIERGEKRAFLTPLERDDETPNYNTFRSYLARYRDEGRIFFNDEKRRWRITENEIEVHTPELEEEYDRSWLFKKVRFKSD